MAFVHVSLSVVMGWDAADDRPWWKSDAFTDTGSIGVMAAVSGSSVYSNFSNGSGINSKEFGYDKYMKQNPKSQLYKMDIRPDEFNSFELSARTYENKFTRRDITSDDYYIKYHYTLFLN